MFAKDVLAMDILSGELHDFQSFINAASSSEYPQLEVRTVGSQGLLQIKVGKSAWMTPAEWVSQHIASLQRNLDSAIQRLSYLDQDIETLEMWGFYYGQNIRANSKDIAARVVRDTTLPLSKEQKYQLLQEATVSIQEHFNQ